MTKKIVYLIVTICLSGCATTYTSPTFEELEQSKIGRCAESFIEKTLLFLGNSSASRELCGESADQIIKKDNQSNK